MYIYNYLLSHVDVSHLQIHSIRLKNININTYTQTQINTTTHMLNIPSGIYIEDTLCLRVSSVILSFSMYLCYTFSIQFIISPYKSFCTFHTNHDIQYHHVPVCFRDDRGVALPSNHRSNRQIYLRS